MPAFTSVERTLIAEVRQLLTEESPERVEDRFVIAMRRKCPETDFLAKLLARMLIDVANGKAVLASDSMRTGGVPSGE